jgi:hypothetical protein
MQGDDEAILTYGEEENEAERKKDQEVIARV